MGNVSLPCAISRAISPFIITDSSLISSVKEVYILGREEIGGETKWERLELLLTLVHRPSLAFDHLTAIATRMKPFVAILPSTPSGSVLLSRWVTMGLTITLISP